VTPQVFQFIGPSNDGRRHGRGTYLFFKQGLGLREAHTAIYVPSCTDFTFMPLHEFISADLTAGIVESYGWKKPLVIASIYMAGDRSQNARMGIADKVHQKQKSSTALCGRYQQPLPSVGVRERLRAW
jgi:hypothetical protein